jgi:hypothetical protein
MDYEEQQLVELKRRLYGALLTKQRNSLKPITDVEINIMFELSKDDDIQKILGSRAHIKAR